MSPWMAFHLYTIYVVARIFTSPLTWTFLTGRTVPNASLSHHLPANHLPRGRLSVNSNELQIGIEH